MILHPENYGARQPPFTTHFSKQSSHLIKHRLQRSRIIGMPVSFCALALDADELADRIALILRARLTEYPARPVQQALRLRRRGNAILHEPVRRARAVVNVALRPTVDRHGAAGQNDRSTHDADGRGDIMQTDVVEDKRPCEGR